MNGARAGMNGCVAVFDLGKTNIKVVVFDSSGNALAERARTNAPLAADEQCPYLSLDAKGAWAFLIGALKDVGARFPIEAISIATHGAAGVLLNDDGLALTPITRRRGRRSRRPCRRACRAASISAARSSILSAISRPNSSARAPSSPIRSISPGA